VSEAERTIDTGIEEVSCRVAERVAVVTLNRPEAKNALTMDMKRALNALLPSLASDTGVGCVLLTGAAGAFCSGGDTKRMKQEGKPPSLEDRIRQLRWEHQIPLALYRMAKPTLAAMPGAAAGAGLALALACDLRIASETLVATTAYARLGLSGDYGSSWFLTQLVGTARARELMYTPGRLDAKTCHALGLVNRVVAEDQLDKEAFAWASEIAAGPPIALRYMKDNLNRAVSQSLEESLDLEADRMPAGAQTEDYIEAVAAFSEKRKPIFRGR
jgi:enoyl-CoA hydratase/carnithine racemase